MRPLSLLTVTLTACAAQDVVESDPAALSRHDRPTASDQADLGQLVFEDKALSEPRGQACASCHDPKRGFAGDDHSKIQGVAAGAVNGVFGTRNTPTATYAMYSPPFHIAAETDDKGAVEYLPTGGQFWDGRVDTLADQAKGPFVNPREMNNPNPAAVIAKIRAANYAPLFQRVCGDRADDAAAFDCVADAIAAFESTTPFTAFSSKFDDYLRGNAQLSASEQHGFELFKDPEKGNCIGCHVGTEGSSDPADWLFTDFTYDNLGVPRNRAIPDNADPAHFDLGLCQRPDLSAKVPADFDIASTCGAFKVPSLRNIALTGPYFHNGVFASLHDVVSFYATRGTNPERWYPDGHFDDLPEAYWGNVNTGEPPYDRKPGETPRLSDAEIDDIVAFLGTLTDAGFRK